MGSGEDKDLDPELASLEEVQAHISASPQNGIAREQAVATGRRRPPKRLGRRASPPAPQAAAPQATPPQPEIPSSIAAPPRPGIDETKSATVVWPRILQEEIAKGYTPEHIGIRVTRVPTGPQKSPPTELASIDGSLVAGSETISPGEALYEYVVSYYHSGFTGPATYKFSFFYRFGASGGGARVNIPGSAELALDHPAVIKRQLEAAERAKEAQRHGAQAMPGAPLGSLYGGPRPSPQGGAGGGPSQREIDLMRDLARENGKYEGIFQEMQRQAAQTPVAQPAPAPAPAPAYDPRLPPPGIRPDEWEMIQENRNAKGVAKAVVQALTALGITPGVLQPQATVQQPQQPPAAPVSALGAIKEALNLLKEVGAFQKQVGEILPGTVPGAPATEPETPEEDPTQMKPLGGGLVKYPGSDSPMVGREKLEDESWFEYLFQMAVNNPAAAQDILGKAMSVLDPAALKELTMAIAQRIKPPSGGSGGAAPAQATTAPAAGGEAPKLGWQPS